MKNNKGFTLLEILLVVGIIGILAAIVIIAINPGRSLAKARDVQRKVGITEINKGLNQYYIDHNQYPSSVLTSLTSICNTGSVSNTATSTTGENCVVAGLINLSELVPTYLPAIPVDPTGVGYKIGFNASRRIMLVADLTETVSPLIAIGTTTYSLPAAIVDICDGTPAAGTVCSDGTVYVNATLRTTPSDAGTMVWANVNQSTGATSNSDGKANTDNLAPRGPGYAAAYRCRNTERTGGYTDWYLPAEDELLTLYSNRFAIGGFHTTGAWFETVYWSSTEDSYDEALSRDFNTGSRYFTIKGAGGYTMPVRCVRSI